MLQDRPAAPKFLGSISFLFELNALCLSKGGSIFVVLVTPKLRQMQKYL